MKIHNIRKYLVLIFASLLTVSILTACGGGGSSTGSGGVAGGATLSGNINSGFAFDQSQQGPAKLLLALLELSVSDAHAGVGGVVVELYLNGSLVDSQTTSASGEFMFSGLQPGNYTLKLSQGGQAAGETPVIKLDANTRTHLDLSLGGNVSNVEVKAEQGTIKGEVEDSADDSGQDDDSNDDKISDNVNEDDQHQDEQDDDSRSDHPEAEDESHDDSQDDSKDDNCEKDDGQEKCDD